MPKCIFYFFISFHALLSFGGGTAWTHLTTEQCQDLIDIIHGFNPATIRSQIQHFVLYYNIKNAKTILSETALSSKKNLIDTLKKPCQKNNNFMAKIKKSECLKMPIKTTEAFKEFTKPKKNVQAAQPYWFTAAKVTSTVKPYASLKEQHEALLKRSSEEKTYAITVKPVGISTGLQMKAATFNNFYKPYINYDDLPPVPWSLENLQE